MSKVLICRDAIEDSVLGNIALARALARDGTEVSIVFTGEALHALDTGTFAWSRNFKTRAAQARIVAAAEAAGLTLGHAGLDDRWSDIRGLVQAVAGQPGIRLIACPIWGGLLELGERVPYLERIDENKLGDLLRNADTVVGGY